MTLFELILQTVLTADIYNIFSSYFKYLDFNILSDYLTFNNKVIGTIIQTDNRRMFNFTIFTQPVIMYLDVDSYEAQLYIKYMHTLYHVNPAKMYLDVETGLLIIDNPSYLYDKSHWWGGEVYDYLLWGEQNLPSELANLGWFDEFNWYCGHWVRVEMHNALITEMNSDPTKYSSRLSAFQYMTPFLDLPDFPIKVKRCQLYEDLIQDGVIQPLKKSPFYWEVNYNFPPIPKPIPYPYWGYEEIPVEVKTWWGKLKDFINGYIDDILWRIRCRWINFMDRLEQHFRVKSDDD